MIGLLLGIFPGILKSILGHLEKKRDAESERLKTIVSAEIQTNEQRSAIVRAQLGEMK